MAALNTTLAPAQTNNEAVVMEMVGSTFAVTTAVIPLLVAVAFARQVALLVSVQVTISPLFKVLVMNVGLLVPALKPFTFHW